MDCGREVGREKGWMEVFWLKCSPDQQSEPSETWANSLFNPFSCFFSPFLSVSLLSSLNSPSLSPSLSLFTFPPSCPLFFHLFSEGSVSKSSCWAAKGEAGKDEASRNDSVYVCWCVCVCVSVCVSECWLSEGGKCEESWLCRLLLFLSVFS